MPVIEDLKTSEAFPEQGSWLGRRVEVVFGYTQPAFKGVIVREDAVEPGLLIIRLDDGRHVMSLECSYRLI
jgi:hypothetical protein